MKKILSVLLALSLVFSLGACSKLSGKDDDSDTRNTNECIKDIPDKNESALKNGKILYFGAYPKEEVWLDWLKDMLNKTLESDYDETEWKTYSFYEGSQYESHNSSLLEYIDVVISGHKYRGARITRHNFVDINEETEEHYSDYSIHWFYYVPLEWQIVDEENGIIICNDIIDYKAYVDETEVNCLGSDWIKDDGTPASDWETSYIKNWLTGDFYEEAFMRSGNGSAEYYEPIIYKDSISLVSQDDVRKYGIDTACKSSDYATYLGVKPDWENEGIAAWMLKDTINSNCVAYYGDDNKVYTSDAENICKPIGIRPMLRITDTSVFDEATLTKDQLNEIYKLHTIFFGREPYNCKSQNANEVFWSVIIPYNYHLNEEYDLGLEHLDGADPLEKFVDSYEEIGKFDAEKIDKIIRTNFCTEPDHNIQLDNLYYYDGYYYYRDISGGGGPAGEFIEDYCKDEDGSYSVSVYEYVWDTYYIYKGVPIEDSNFIKWSIQAVDIDENFYEDLFVF